MAKFWLQGYNDRQDPAVLGAHQEIMWVDLRPKHGIVPRSRCVLDIDLGQLIEIASKTRNCVVMRNNGPMECTPERPYLPSLWIIHRAMPDLQRYLDEN